MVYGIQSCELVQELLAFGYPGSSAILDVAECLLFHVLLPRCAHWNLYAHFTIVPHVWGIYQWFPREMQ